MAAYRQATTGTKEPLSASKVKLNNMKTFILYWKDIEIGTLTETNWDMRSGGVIEYKYDYLCKEHENKHLSKFIKHSIQAGIYLENGDESNYKRMCIEETQFFDLINGSEWRIVNEDGESCNILCPVFLDGNSITWQKTYDGI